MFPKRNLKRNLTKFIQQPIYGTKVFLKRIKAEMYYKLNPSKAPLPEAVTFFLTHSCNLRCKMCGQWGDKGVTKLKADVARNMDFEQIKGLVDDLSKFKPNITLFGGEPLLHKNVMDVIRQIKSHDMHCLMITNGFLLEKYADELIDAGIDELNISIDGVGSVHDEIRGINGLYEKIFDGIKKITDNRKSKKPLINIQTTITKYNYKNLESMLEAAEAMKADSITFHHLIYLEENDIKQTRQNYPYLDSDDWEGFVADPGMNSQALIESLNKIESMKKKYGFMINIYPNFTNEEIEKYYKDNSWFPESYSGKCMSPWICAYIFPDGKLRPCLNFHFSFGNLKEVKFKNAWNSREAKKFRTDLNNAGKFPVCKRCTEIFRY